MRRHVKFLYGLLVAGAALVALAGAASPASADYVHTGTFSGLGSGSGQIDTPGRAAVEQSSGNLFVVDSGNDRVQVFSPDGPGSAASLTEFGGGELSEPWGIAIDEEAGQTYVYVADAGNDRILKYDSDEAAVPTFSLSGSFASPAKGAGAGEVGDFRAALAVDPASHDLLVADNANKRIARFEANGTANGSFDGSAGVGSPGAFQGPIDLAVNSAGDLYVIDANGPNIAKQEGTSHVLRYSAGGQYKATLGPVGTHERPATVAVNPLSDEVAVTGDPDAVYEAGPQPYVPVIQFFDSADNPLPSPQVNTEALYDSVGGLAIASNSTDRLYVVFDVGYYFSETYGQPQIQVFEVVSPPEVTIDPVDQGTVTATEATFAGTVDPNSSPTEWHFEYRRVGAATWTSSPTEDAGSGDVALPVSFEATGLATGAQYEVRLIASSLGGSETSDPPNPTFTTGTAPPAIVEQLPLDVEQTKATLRAKVNPNGLPTTYHFEWGTDASYGNRIPADHELFVGSGSDPVAVPASPGGLQEDTVYHFRVVATNADGTTVGPDQPFSTLNEDGLAWGRRYELVSPPNKGPAGQAGQNLALGGIELQYQASPDGKAIAYSISYGLSDATSGGEVPYRSDRSPDAWLTTQTAPSMAGMPQGVVRGERNIYGRFNSWLSSDLDCAFSISSLPLTDDPQALPVIEAGGHNLYRRNPDGSYDLVTNLVPTNLANASPQVTDSYFVPEASEDCQGVVFETNLKYPGVTFTSGSQPGAGVYEWRDGVLSNPTLIPGPSGPEFADQAWPGADPTPNTHRNSVSDDGSRFFFTAQSKFGDDVGKKAIFLSDGSGPAQDISQSQTATVNDGDSRYQMATPSGSHAFFIARYGLAADESSTGASSCSLPTLGDDLGIGCDLYRYSVDSETLTDLSPSSNPDDTAGASVAGVLDASEDGSRVYFAAKGQLVPGEGQTYAENTAGATLGYNIYLWDSGTLAYVATVLQSDVTGSDIPGVFREPFSGLLVSSPLSGMAERWASQTTPDGEFLVFQSRAEITDDSGGVQQAYRYSAESGVTECISCRRDGQTPLEDFEFPPLPYIAEDGSSDAHLMPTISSDGSTVFFRSRSPLTPDAISGVVNLYEWHDGQVSFLVSHILGTADGREKNTGFRGASGDGSTVFFRTKRSLVPEDTDGHQDIYAARVGGGFDPPAPPPPPCDALSDSSCLGPVAPANPSGAPGSSTLVGPGNVQSKPPCKKGKVRRKGKCVKKNAGNKKKKGKHNQRSAK